MQQAPFEVVQGLREDRRRTRPRPLSRKRLRRISWLVASAIASLVHAQDVQAIVGGAPAEEAIGQSLVMVLAEGGGACSGVIIAPRAILTAGHCLPRGHQIRVYAPSGDKAAAPRLIVPAASALNPGYAPNSIGTRRRSVDLALIRLPETLPPPYTALSLSSTAAPDQGETIVLAGDGLSQEGVAASSGKPRSVSLPVIEPFGRGNILLWAAPADGAGSGACEGDSGGAMLTPRGALVAIIAFAEGAGRSRCGKLTQGVLVAPQRQFIDTKLDEWGESARWTDQ